MKKNKITIRDVQPKVYREPGTVDLYFYIINSPLKVKSLKLVDEAHSLYQMPYVMMPGMDMFHYDGRFTLVIHVPGLHEIKTSFKQFTRTKKKIDKLAAMNKYELLFKGVIEKRIGLVAYLDAFDEIPDDQKWDAFIAIYTRVDYGFELLYHHFEKIAQYAPLSKQRNKRIATLKKKQGSKPFPIYHGATSSNFNPNDFYSWSLSRETAKWFATRYFCDGTVARTIIELDQAIDYIESRSESEILFIPPDRPKSPNKSSLDANKTVML